MDKTVEERLLEIEDQVMQLLKGLDLLRGDWQKLEMSRRQANLMEVDAQERMLNIFPTTAQARKQTKEQLRG